MKDILDILKNIETITETPNAFEVLKDFERVLDELDLYVYANWKDGELAMGPKIDRYWVTCGFMWPRNKMPDPMGGKRLLDYDCKVRYKKESLMVPRQIESPDDIRPGTKKGKLDREDVWIVEIEMPKKLMKDIYGGHKAELDQGMPGIDKPPPVPQEADMEAESTPDVGGDGGLDAELGGDQNAGGGL